jgi:prepilin-type N-terminal cleavage/methylation domain-containing protein
MRHPVTSRSRRGFTLIELLVVISVIAVLATMVFPAIGLIRRLANESKCANNLKGLAGAWVAANQDESNPWLKQARFKSKNQSATATAMAQAKTTPAYPEGAEDAAKFTAAAFECWTVVQELPAALFKCPSQANTAYTVPDPTVKKAALSRADVTWGWSEDSKIPYSFDYCAPSDSASGRVVFADRDPSNHGNKTAIVAKADASTAKLTATTAAPANVAAGGSKSWAYEAESGFYAVSKDGTGSDSAVGEEADQNVETDNIYDSAGDLPANADAKLAFKPGSASTRRAFVK